MPKDYFSTTLKGYVATGYMRGSLVYVPGTVPPQLAMDAINQFMADKQLLTNPVNGVITAEWEIIAVAEDTAVAYSAGMFVWVAEEQGNPDSRAVVYVKSVMQSQTQTGEAWEAQEWSAHAPIPVGFVKHLDWASDANMASVLELRQYGLQHFAINSDWETLTF